MQKGYKMNDFISTIRTDRLREINEKKKMGIIIQDEYSYRYVDKIQLILEDETMIFGVQANNRDIYFFIIDEGANSYFTVYDIYMILSEICAHGNEETVINVLNEMNKKEMKKISNPDEKKENWINRGRFRYQDVEYNLKEAVIPDHHGKYKQKDGARDITYKQLFVLINLIQEKSNAFFTRGKNKDELNVNGLVRLLSALLSSHTNIKLLNEMGWFYNNDEEHFQLKKELSLEDKKHYYLTQEEFDSIICSES